MREKPRLVLDTNLFVSALISPRSTPNQLLQLWEQGGIVILASGKLIHEVDNVLHRAYIKERYHWLRNVSAGS